MILSRHGDLDSIAGNEIRCFLIPDYPRERHGDAPAAPRIGSVGALKPWHLIVLLLCIGGPVAIVAAVVTLVRRKR